jgi:hypothetical protein
LEVVWHNNFGVDSAIKMTFSGEPPKPYVLSGLYNTGVGNDKKKLEPGEKDPHWTVNRYSGDGRNEPIKVIFPRPPHMSNDVDDLSNWVGWYDAPSTGLYAVHTNFTIS